MKILVTIIVIVGLGVGGYFLWRNWQERRPVAAQSHRATTAAIETRNINFSVNVAGEIAPAEQVSVRPEINGRIATLPVDIGDKVKKGETLFTLDDKELQNQRSSAVTEIDRAKLQLAQAQRNFDRSQQLFQDKLVSEEEFENSKTELALARNALERSERELAVVEERLTKTKIAAPFDCTVLIRPVSVGQAVSGSGGVGGGTEVLAIADLNEMVINAHVNQADVTRLKVGQEVNIQVEAVAGLEVKGVVERIAPQATIKNNIKGFAARIVIKSPDQRIQPGMTANISIPVASADDVLAAPLASIFTEYNPESGQNERFVYVKKGEKIERRPIRIGISDYFHAEVLSGVQEGEIVLLEPPPESVIQQLSNARSGSREARTEGGRPREGRRTGEAGRATGGRPASREKPANASGTRPVKAAAKGT